MSDEKLICSQCDKEFERWDRNEQIAEGLKYRQDETNKHRDQQVGYACSLYVNEHINSEQFLNICTQIH